MAAELRTREDTEGLRFRVRKGPELWVIPVEIAVGAIVVYVLLHTADLHPLVALILAALCTLQVIRDLIARTRGTDVEFAVSDAALISAGHAPDGYKPSEMRRVDVSNMKYDAPGGGPDGPNLPSGLYVERYDKSTWNSGKCMLPGIDEAEAKSVIAAILRRFPDTEIVGPGQMSKGGLTVLDLHETKQD